MGTQADVNWHKTVVCSRHVGLWEIMTKIEATSNVQRNVNRAQELSMLHR